VKTVSELNKLKLQLFVEAVLNEGRLELIDELVAADYIGHVPGAETAVIGPEGIRQLVSSCRRACPGLYIKIEDQIAEDDRVVTRWQATTTAPGAQPAGCTPCCAGISVVRFLAGMQVDSHTECTNVTANRPAEPANLTTPSPGEQAISVQQIGVGEGTRRLWDDRC
jgi:predicted SnoaL-like aldol condensation-catalyzing enzyme